MARMTTEDLRQVLGERQVFRDALLLKMKEANLHPSELARQAKVSKDAISSYVTMRSLPSEETLAKIARALKCKPADLNRAAQGDEPPPVCELREHSKTGYSVLNVRLPMPDADAAQYLAKLLPFKTSFAKGKRS